MPAPAGWLPSAWVWSLDITDIRRFWKLFSNVLSLIELKNI